MSSDPPLSRSPLAILEHHHQPPLLPLAAASAAVAGGVSAPSPSSSVLSREYRKGNWTVQETLILINAKRLDDDRRSRGGATTSSSDLSAAPRSAEQRWKWVENYCWKQGCLRSQNQCNDKWDNLLRDYKKVRDYESRATAGAATAATAAPASYWSLERHERKERNLPTNLAFEVYEALADVLSRRATLRSGGGAVASPHPRPLPLLPPPPPPPPPPAQASVSGEMTPEGSSETEGSGGAGDGCPSPLLGGKRKRGLGSSVVRGAAELARALIACEERKERRHRDLLELEERRLRMEENRTEMHRQAVAGLIAAVTGLSAAIHSLVADHRSGHSR